MSSFTFPNVVPNLSFFSETKSFLECVLVCMDMFNTCVVQ